MNGGADRSAMVSRQSGTLPRSQVSLGIVSRGARRGILIDVYS